MGVGHIRNGSLPIFLCLLRNVTSQVHDQGGNVVGLHCLDVGMLLCSKQQLCTYLNPGKGARFLNFFLCLPSWGRTFFVVQTSKTHQCLVSCVSAIPSQPNLLAPTSDLSAWHLAVWAHKGCLASASAGPTLLRARAPPALSCVQESAPETLMTLIRSMNKGGQRTEAMPELSCSRAR